MEIWKDIENYKGLYQVSNYGNVRSLDRHVQWKNTLVFKPSKILSQIPHTFGYTTIKLSKNGIVDGEYVHRLVAMTWIPNPNNYDCVLHKDDNPKNNHIANLMWGTKDMNNKDMASKSRVRNQYTSIKN